MKIKFLNGTELDCLGVHSFNQTYEGVTREGLTFLFDGSTELSLLIHEFTPENTKTLVFIDDAGQYIHEHYTIRVSLGIGEMRDVTFNTGSEENHTQVAYVKMLQSTLAERELRANTEAIEALIAKELEGGN